MRKFAALLGVVFVLSVFATARAEDPDPSRYRTFAWKVTSAILPPDAHKALEETVVRDLEAKGYRSIPAAEAELILTYKVLATDEANVQAFGYADPDSWAIANYGGTGVREYRKGRLAVYAEDRATGALVWSAEGEANVKDAADAEKKVRKLAGKLFKSWPAAR
jgi:hypothetical protein